MVTYIFTLTLIDNKKLPASKLMSKQTKPHPIFVHPLYAFVRLREQRQFAIPKPSLPKCVPKKNAGIQATHNFVSF